MEGIGTVAAIGGLILAAVLLWAVLRNRQRTAADVRRTNEATADLYRKVDREDQATDPDKNSF